MTPCVQSQRDLSAPAAMPTVSVWAPGAQRVRLDLGAAQIEMDPQQRGWWTAPAPEAGSEYALLVDGGSPLPDPRSAWQPSGVHGRSCWIDHAAFSWTDSCWQAPPLESGIFYELHVGTFTPEGTFDAAIGRIPHLRNLGITHVELMPVAEFPGDWGWGYDGVDLYAPHHVYGGPEGLKRLVDALHGSGIAALLDVVYNHLGPLGNYLAQFGPYFTARFKTPWGDAVNLSEAGSEEVRRFFIDNALMWLQDYHFDGLRLDAVHAIVDPSATHFLEELTDRVNELQIETGRHLWLIAESDLNDPRLLRSPEAGGYGISAQWSDDFHHALHTVLTGESRGYYFDFGTLAQLAKAITHGFVYDGCYSEFRCRRHGKPLGSVAKSRLLGYLQTHDQVGNRARGDRITDLCSLDRVKIGVALVMTAPFIPMLFQGEEWGASTPFQYFTSHPDPDLGRAVSEGRQREFREFGWRPEDVPDPQDPATFWRSKLNWAEIGQGEHAKLLDWYRELIRFRKETPALRAAPAETAFDEASRYLIVRRGDYAVTANLSDTWRGIPWNSGGRLMHASKPGVETLPEELRLPPESAAILWAPR
jgi:maltooligosyltrehalose trehalohydrolase